MTEPKRMDEEVLAGGGVNRVVRIGSTVRRPVGPWTHTVHALLDHLQAAGFPGAPRAHGFDTEGREILDFLPGLPLLVISRIQLSRVPQVGQSDDDGEWLDGKALCQRDRRRPGSKLEKRCSLGWPGTCCPGGASRVQAPPHPMTIRAVGSARAEQTMAAGKDGYGDVVIELRDSAAHELQSLLSWISSEEELRLWSGSGFSWPLSAEQLRVYLEDSRSGRRLLWSAVTTNDAVLVGRACLAVNAQSTAWDGSAACSWTLPAAVRVSGGHW